MTTVEVETYADTGSLSHPDINLKVLLRRNCIPAFLDDAGYTSWRRKVASLTLAPGDKQKDLPDDFWQMQIVSFSSDLTCGLEYIGEDPDKLIVGEANTTRGKPSGYYLKTRSATGLLTATCFNAPADTSYTAYYAYYSGVFFPDDTTSVDLNKYIPPQYQWALVEKLKSEILLNRFGIGDPRYVASEQQYGIWVARASASPELARRSHAVFVR